MSSKYIIDTDMRYECRYCPQCDAINWVGEYVNLIETEGIQCWKCRYQFWLDGFGLNDANFADDAVAVGVPDPIIPVEMLSTIADLAVEQLEELKWSVRSKNEDPEIVSVIDDITQTVNYIKSLIGSKVIPVYDPPV